jgi:hypothetical protein
MEQERLGRVRQLRGELATFRKDIRSLRVRQAAAGPDPVRQRELSQEWDDLRARFRALRTAFLELEKEEEEMSDGLDCPLLEEEKEVKDARYHACERFSGSFARSFALPDGIDADKISAEFKDGILEIRAPLPAEAKQPAITIPVKG